MLMHILIDACSNDSETNHNQGAPTSHQLTYPAVPCVIWRSIIRRMVYNTLMKKRKKGKKKEAQSSEFKTKCSGFK